MAGSRWAGGDGGPGSAEPARSVSPGWPAPDRRTGVVVCRGCCCGSHRRDPRTDHAGQLARLRSLAEARPAEVEVRTTECLGPCEQANVIVVRPSPGGRRRGGRPVWLAFLGDTRALDLLEQWVTAGGPGLARIPPELDLHVTRAPRRTRAEDRPAIGE